MKVRYEFEMPGEKVDCVNCPLAVKLVNNNKGELWCKPMNVKLVGEITGKVKSVFYRECPLDIVAETPAEKFKNEIDENLGEFRCNSCMNYADSGWGNKRCVSKGCDYDPIIDVKKEHEEEVIRETMSAMDCQSL